ncbi:phytoene synthase [Bhargavaea cecembensis]|uniref:Phytoene synthase n=1 Tax=Bhargavaea cecembensis TaxID=394098 RepID=A0A165GQJ9_9BACL|nr:phytoene/squalene synthase family protein [Bhargavaea cecembensis]KZE37289.1 phytoene synthase [Bhargavaea cecembensis]
MTLSLSRSTQEDYRYCEAIIKRHSKSFYYAFSKLPAEKARAVYAIYAFCRTADDSVDGSGSREERMAALGRLAEDLDRFRYGQDPDTPLWRALRDVFSRFDMDFQPFYDQLTGQRMDIDFSQPADLRQLEEYSYYVAGSVGMMLLPIIAPDAGPETRRRAADLGIAMQLTNILRDVGEDLRDNGRIYLPLDDMNAHGYQEEDLQFGVIDIRFTSLWEAVAVRAEELYDRFGATLGDYSADSRIPVALSAGVYRGILNAVRNNGYDCFSRRAVVGQIEKGRIALSVKAGLRGKTDSAQPVAADVAP